MRKLLYFAVGFFVMITSFVIYKEKRSVLDAHTKVKTNVETFVAAGNIA